MSMFGVGGMKGSFVSSIKFGVMVGKVSVSFPVSDVSAGVGGKKGSLAAGVGGSLGPSIIIPSSGTLVIPSVGGMVGRRILFSSSFSEVENTSRGYVVFNISTTTTSVASINPSLIVIPYEPFMTSNAVIPQLEDIPYWMPTEIILDMGELVGLDVDGFKLGLIVGEEVAVETGLGVGEVDVGLTLVGDIVVPSGIGDGVTGG